jgi:hypothetical protein
MEDVGIPILWRFGIVYSHLVYFMNIGYMYFVVIWYFFFVLVCCIKKYLATLNPNPFAMIFDPSSDLLVFIKAIRTVFEGQRRRPSKLLLCEGHRRRDLRIDGPTLNASLKAGQRKRSVSRRHSQVESFPINVFCFTPGCESTELTFHVRNDMPGL